MNDNFFIQWQNNPLSAQHLLLPIEDDTAYITTMNSHEAAQLAGQLGIEIEHERLRDYVDVHVWESSKAELYVITPE